MNRVAAVLILLMLAFSCTASGAEKVYRPDKSNDELLQSLITEYAPKFTHSEYADDSGMKLPFMVYVPESYSADKKFPVVFFIADGSAAGKSPEFSLTQGIGGLIWCKHECIVIVPYYPSMILDDHNGFIESLYVELTGHFVEWAVKNYPIDESRIYATGQSMGCMTFLVLAARHPEMFTACMFVSGQWDINELKGLLRRRFVYIASAGDPKASVGMNEVIDMFKSNDNDGFSALSEVDAKIPDKYLYLWEGQPANFIMFRKGSTLPDDMDGDFSEHMSSFDYAYKLDVARNWLLAQKKEVK
ncbi:MAG: prolyl oligopeptidase family serine peptidase [Synergistaceae bacterium]|nr:prolyl oligopeptidase family serine peptidase [Synergistaceae bacterium]